MSTKAKKLPKLRFRKLKKLKFKPLRRKKARRRSTAETAKTDLVQRVRDIYERLWISGDGLWQDEAETLWETVQALGATERHKGGL